MKPQSSAGVLSIDETDSEGLGNSCSFSFPRGIGRAPQFPLPNLLHLFPVFLTNILSPLFLHAPADLVSLYSLTNLSGIRTHKTRVGLCDGFQDYWMGPIRAEITLALRNASRPPQVTRETELFLEPPQLPRNAGSIGTLTEPEERAIITEGSVLPSRA